MWNEILTPDPAAAGAFLTALFGWEADEQTMPDGRPYTLFTLAGRPEAGMMRPDEDWGIPPAWVVYFGTRDIGAAAAAVGEGGGRATFEPFEVPGTGNVGWFTDSQGATVALLEPAPM